MSSFFEEERNLRIKGYFSFIGHSLTTLITGNSLSLLQLSNYYLSYLSKNEFNIPKYYSRIFIALVITLSNLSNILSNILTYYLNLKTIIFISYFLLMTSVLLLYYSFNLILIFLAFIFYGIGIGFSYHPLINNTSNFFPEKKNLFSFINLIIYSISSPLFYLILDKIIEINNGNFIEGIKKYLYFLIGLYIFFGLISISIIFDYQKQFFDESEFDEELSDLEDNNNIETSINLSIIGKKNESIKIKKNYKKSSSLPSKKTSNAELMLFTSSFDYNSIHNFYNKIFHEIKNRNFWVISIFYFTSMLVVFNFFIKIKEKEIFRFIMTISIFRFFGPFILKILGSKFLSLITIFIQIIILILEKYYNLTSKQKLYIIIGKGFSFGIYSIIISSIIPQKFGYETNFILTGIIISFGTLSLWLNFLFRIFDNDPELEFSLLLILCFLSIIFLLMIKGSFIYYNRKNSNENNNSFSSNYELEEKEDD
jgi:MFS family permease